MIKPTVGATVHYVSYATGEPVCRAAIITAVDAYPPDASERGEAYIAAPVDVTVFLPDTHFTDRSMQSEVGREGGTWHWPEEAS